MTASAGQNGSSGTGLADPLLQAQVPLSPELDAAFQKLKAAFTITTSGLKDITHHFHQELEAGLQKTEQNIVSFDHPLL